MRGGLLLRVGRKWREEVYLFNPVNASRYIDTKNGKADQPNLLPGFLTGKSFKESKMGQDPIYGENGQVVNFWASDQNPIFRTINYITPSAPSATAYHDTGIVL